MERRSNSRRKGKAASGVRSTAKKGNAKAKASRTSPPRNLRFLHLVIDIQKHPEPELSEELGQWDIRPARIMYDASANPNVIRETLLHESLHAVLEHTSVANAMHEEIISAMSPLLLHMLRANPALVRYLCAD